LCTGGSFGVDRRPWGRIVDVSREASKGIAMCNRNARIHSDTKTVAGLAGQAQVGIVFSASRPTVAIPAKPLLWFGRDRHGWPRTGRSLPNHSKGFAGMATLGR